MTHDRSSTHNLSFSKATSPSTGKRFGGLRVQYCWITPGVFRSLFNSAAESRRISQSLLLRTVYSNWATCSRKLLLIFSSNKVEGTKCRRKSAELPQLIGFVAGDQVIKK